MVTDKVVSEHIEITIIDQYEIIALSLFGEPYIFPTKKNVMFVYPTVSQVIQKRNMARFFCTKIATLPLMKTYIFLYPHCHGPSFLFFFFF